MRTFGRQVLALAAAIVGFVARAEAQINPAPIHVPQPTAWVSFSAGILQLQAIEDGTTQTDWQFGDAVQYRVAFEVPMQYQSTLGVTATIARVPLTYAPFGGSPLAVCAMSCDADANVMQLLASFHAGRSAIGFHQVIDLALGTTVFANFRERTSGAKLAPDKPDADLALQIGYGFGYTLSPAMQINLVQDFALNVHQRTGLAGGARSTSQQYTTRLGLRLGLGSK